MGGGRGTDDVVLHVMERVPRPTAVQLRVMLLPIVPVVLTGDDVKSGVVAVCGWGGERQVKRDGNVWLYGTHSPSTRPAG